MSIRVVMFDWDGTLICSLEWKIHNGGILFSEVFGVPALDVEAAYRLHSGIPRRELFAAICKEVDLPALDQEQYSMMSTRFSEMNLIQKRACTGVHTIAARRVLRLI